MTTSEIAFDISETLRRPTDWIGWRYYSEKEEDLILPPDIRDKVDSFDDQEHMIELEGKMIELLKLLNNQQVANFVLVPLLRHTEFLYYDSVFKKDVWGPDWHNKFPHIKGEIREIFDWHTDCTGLYLFAFWMGLKGVISSDIFESHSYFTLIRDKDYGSCNIELKPNNIPAPPSWNQERSIVMNGLTVKALALKTYIETIEGRIEGFREKFEGKREDIRNYGSKLGVSGHRFYQLFVKIEKSGGGDGYGDRELESLENHFEGDDQMLHLLKKLKGGYTFKV